MKGWFSEEVELRVALQRASEPVSMKQSLAFRETLELAQSAHSILLYAIKPAKISLAFGGTDESVPFKAGWGVGVNTCSTSGLERLRRKSKLPAGGKRVRVQTWVVRVLIQKQQVGVASRRVSGIISRKDASGVGN
ncbi:MAG TPA: hypothetical protein VG225_06760 [Terracidiphilus sp.]|jgi:hypothetical protein|nr:hypothetical protein [Terracidiphilus sp.]